MKFPLTDQQFLLQLQEVDLELIQVQRRLKALPIAAEVKELELRATDVHHHVVQSQTESADLTRAVAKSEDELARVWQRADRDRELADSGVTARVQQELQHELSSLTRRLADLEDLELEMMQRQEDLADLIVRLQVTEQEVSASLETARAERDRQQQEVVTRGQNLTAKRATLLKQIPEALVEAYDRVRREGGAGAAVILHGQCQGCRLALPPMEVARLLAAPVEDIEFCEECGAILVREQA